MVDTTRFMEVIEDGVWFGVYKRGILNQHAVLKSNALNMTNCWWARSYESPLWVAVAIWALFEQIQGTYG